MSNLGPLCYFLGIVVSSTLEGYYLSQGMYIQDLIAHVCLTDQRTVEAPMELGVHLRPTDDESLEDSTRYCQLIGTLPTLGSLDLTFLTLFTF